MKKLLAFLLAAILVFALAACGGNDSYAKYEELYQYLEAKDYDSAAAYIQNLAENGEDASDAEENAPSTVVEITLDNWEDYFEIRLTAIDNRNAFGELEGFYPCYCLFLKDEWAGRVVDLDLAIERSVTDTRPCWYDYDTVTGEVVRGGYQYDESKCMSSSVLCGQGDTISLTWIDMDDPELCALSDCVSYFENFTMNGTHARTVGESSSDLKIVRIQGTLTIID